MPFDGQRCHQAVHRATHLSAGTPRRPTPQCARALAVEGEPAWQGLGLSAEDYAGLGNIYVAGTFYQSVNLGCGPHMAGGVGIPDIFVGMLSP